MKIIKVLIFAIAIIVLIGLIGFFILFNPFEKPVSYSVSKNINKTVVGAEQINLVLYNIKAYELHNIPLSRNTPKIEFVLGDEIYSTEVIDNKPVTRKSSIEGVDLRIMMNKEEFIRILNSADLKKDLQESVASGKTKIEMVAGKTELFFKGYLSIYKEITGKDFS